MTATRSFANLLANVAMLPERADYGIHPHNLSPIPDSLRAHIRERQARELAKGNNPRVRAAWPITRSSLGDVAPEWHSQGDTRHD